MIFPGKYHIKPNDYILGCLTKSPGLVCYQAQASYCHRIHSLVIEICLYFVGSYLGIKCISSSPSNGTYILLEFVIVQY